MTLSGAEDTDAYRFGAFRLEQRTRVLFGNEQPVPLTPKAFDVLLHLVEHAGEVVEKGQLLRAVWPHTFVEESNLAQNIFVLRKALGEAPNDHRFIVTVPGRGYRFVAPVERSDQQPRRPAPESRAAAPSGPVETIDLQSSKSRRIVLGVATGLVVLCVAVMWRPAHTWLRSDTLTHFGEGPGSTTDFDAYDAYLKGRYFWNKRNREALEKSLSYFTAAIARDPSYAQAWAGLADTQALLGHATDAKASARRALMLEPALTEPHATLALQYLFADRKLAEAELEFTAALRLNPEYATAHHWYAFLLLARGRTGEAVREMRRALELDPLSVIISTDLCQALYFDGRENDAIAQCRRALDIDPEFVMAHCRLGEIYLKERRWAEALAELKHGGWGAAVLRLIETKGHAHPDALLNQQVEVAEAYAALGQREHALEWITRAASARRPEIVLVSADPLFAALRNDQAFKAALGL